MKPWVPTELVRGLKAHGTNLATGLLNPNSIPEWSTPRSPLLGQTVSYGQNL